MAGVYLITKQPRKPKQPEYSEADIERYLHQRVLEMGGSHRRVAWQNRKYAPDDFILLPEQGRNLFAECKASGRAKTMNRTAHGRGQLREMADLRKAGCEAYIFDSFEEIDRVLGSWPHLGADNLGVAMPPVDDDSMV